MIVVFAGAGASKAVDPNKYLTTIDFFNNLPETITQNPIFNSTVELITNQKKSILPDDSDSSVIIDIEDVLWVLQELLNFLQRLGDTNTVEGWFMEGNARRLIHLVQGEHKIKHLVNHSPSIAKHVEDLISSINQQVYQYYKDLPSIEQLSNSWLPLIKELIKHHRVLEIFTTNYDRVIESAIDAYTREINSEYIETGRIGTVDKRMDFDLWDKPNYTREIGGLLTKLHGSVDWIRSGDIVYSGFPDFVGSHDRHLIIYPGYKGHDVPEPFTLFHDHFKRCLQHNILTAIIFIGFAFRDSYINDILDRFLNERAKKIVINPSKIEYCPFDDFIHIEQGFDENSVQECLSALGYEK